MKAQNIVNNQNINKIIKSYFLLSFRKIKLINIKRVERKRKPFLPINILLSKVELKYTNSKVVVRLFSFNPGREYAFFSRFTRLFLYVHKMIYEKLYSKLT